jgi:hypothetical protein
MIQRKAHRHQPANLPDQPLFAIFRSFAAPAAPQAMAGEHARPHRAAAHLSTVQRDEKGAGCPCPAGRDGMTTETALDATGRASNPAASGENG